MLFQPTSLLRPHPPRLSLPNTASLTLQTTTLPPTIPMPMPDMLIIDQPVCVIDQFMNFLKGKLNCHIIIPSLFCVGFSHRNNLFCISFENGAEISHACVRSGARAPAGWRAAAIFYRSVCKWRDGTRPASKLLSLDHSNSPPSPPLLSRETHSPL